MTNQTTKTRDSFIFYRSFFQATKKLSKEDKAELFDAICSYALDGELTEMSAIPDAIFSVIQPNLDANRRRWENGCKEKKKNNDKQKISKTEAKDKQKISKNEANKDKDKDVNVDKDKECKSESKSKKQFKAPTLQDVQNYCKERNNCVDAKKFFDYYSAGDWKDAKGNQVKNWKQKLLTWESKDTNETRPESNTNQHTVDFINKMIGHTWITQIIISSPNKAQIWFSNADDFKKYQNLDIDLRSKVKEKITEELNITNFEPKF